jgi:hypothetical protein
MRRDDVAQSHLNVDIYRLCPSARCEWSLVLVRGVGSVYDVRLLSWLLVAGCWLL